MYIRDKFERGEESRNTKKNRGVLLIDYNLTICYRDH